MYNREVAEKDLQIVKDVWYVGTDGKAAGEIQGKLLKELWDKQKQSVDRNQNGKLDYILIEGKSLIMIRFGELTDFWSQEENCR